MVKELRFYTFGSFFIEIMKMNFTGGNKNGKCFM